MSIPWVCFFSSLLEELLRRFIPDAVHEELRALGVPDAPLSTAPDPSRLRDGPMTTAQAARYCGFKTTAAIRKAFGEGRLVPLGKRGGKGTYIWSREALDAFLAGARGGIVPSGRPGAPPENDVRRGRASAHPDPERDTDRARRSRGVHRSEAGQRPTGRVTRR